MTPTPRTPNTRQAMLQWLQHLKAAGAAADTLAAYERDLKHLIACYDLPSPQHYARNHLQFALGELQAQGLQPRSLARLLSAWRNFFNWFSEQYQSGYNPCLGVQAPKGHYPDPKILSLTQTQQLLEASSPTEDRSAVELRDQALFELLYSSGLRLSELIWLDVEVCESPAYTSKAWIDWEENEVVIAAASERQRHVPIGGPALTALTRWRQRRHELLPTALAQQPEQDPANYFALFLGVRGQRISPRVIQKQLQLRAQQAGLNQRVFPHRLRNSFANHLLESSNDVTGVQQLMGHAISDSTASLKQLNPEQLAEFFKAHPRHNPKKDD